MVDEGKNNQKNVPRTSIQPFVQISDEELEERNKIMKPLEEQLIESAKQEIADSLAIVKPEEEKKKDAEEKVYIILFSFEDNEGDSNWWQKVTGRTAAYECIKTNIDGCNIHDSFILVEGLPLERCVSVYEFMRHVKEKGYFEDSFDIEDYNNGYEESEEANSDQSLVSGIPDNVNQAPIRQVSPFTHLNANEQDV